jgi:hypothetical protein
VQMTFWVIFPAFMESDTVSSARAATSAGANYGSHVADLTVVRTDAALQDSQNELPTIRGPAMPAATLQFIAVLTAGLMLAACGKDQPAEQAATTAATTAPAPTPATAVSSQVAAMTADQLREAASKAYAENRLYAPAGDNAVEYYLALRDKRLTPRSPAP